MVCLTTEITEYFTEAHSVSAILCVSQCASLCASWLNKIYEIK